MQDLTPITPRSTLIDVDASVALWPDLKPYLRQITMLIGGYEGIYTQVDEAILMATSPD